MEEMSLPCTSYLNFKEIALLPIRGEVGWERRKFPMLLQGIKPSCQIH
jgi:hypothetical protein